MHVHRRMVGREIEREEVVPLGLDLGADGDREAERVEDLDDLVDDSGNGMLGADPASAGGHGEIERGALAALLLFLERRPPRGKGRLELSLQLVDGGAVALALFDRQRCHRLEGAREHAALAAEERDFFCLEPGRRRARESPRGAEGTPRDRESRGHGCGV